jgi:hypothetical protein
VAVVAEAAHNNAAKLALNMPTQAALFVLILVPS